MNTLMNWAVDTNVFIDLFDDSSEFSPFARLLFDSAERGGVRLVASELVLAELLSKQMDEAMATQILADTRGLAVDFKPIATTHLLEAARIRRLHRLTLPDAIHVATAGSAGATHFITNDHKVLNKTIPTSTVTLTSITRIATILPSVG